MSDNTFYDPLEELMDRVDAPIEKPAEEPATSIDSATDDDEYGKNDLAKEIAEEDAADAAEIARRQAIAQAEYEASNQSSTVMPPISIDKEYQQSAVMFQANKLDIVGKMIDQVVQANNLPAGGIPVSTDEDPDLQRHIMGELIALYERDGEVVSQEFTDLIVKNWVAAQPVEPVEQAEEVKETPEELEQKLQVLQNTPAQININVEAGTPVTVNVDQDVVASMSQTKQVDIVVKEVSHDEILAARVITNSQDPSIIQPYVSDQYDVPLTLALSGYRCVLRPVNYHEFIQLGSSPSSGTAVDQEIKQWSIIYDHIKNVSIGPFADFEDFLKKTKYSDRELLMWGILLGAADDEETISIRCGNPKCRKSHTLKYRPRQIIHVNDELMKKYQSEITHTVAPGDDALAHFNKINPTKKKYRLPHTDYIIEIEDRPSAYDFLNRRYPLMDQLEKRFYPEGRNPDDPEIPEYGYLLAHALFITAISIVKQGADNKPVEYKYTTWEDIEKIITKSLNMQDEAILMQLVGKLANATASPVQFYLENFTCDACGYHEDRIPIPDIGDTLIFQLSQRLASTEIKLIETESI